MLETRAIIMITSKMRVKERREKERREKERREKERREKERREKERRVIIMRVKEAGQRCKVKEVKTRKQTNEQGKRNKLDV